MVLERVHHRLPSMQRPPWPHEREPLSESIYRTDIERPQITYNEHRRCGWVQAGRVPVVSERLSQLVNGMIHESG